MRLTGWAATVVVVLSLAGCSEGGAGSERGGAGGSSPVRNASAVESPPSAPEASVAPEKLADAVRDLPGSPLPSKLLGSYEENATHLGKTILWELLPAGHEQCVELVQTDDSCITWRDTFDKFDHPAAYGAATVRDGKLVLSYVSDRYSKECWGSKGVYEYEMKGDRLYFLDETSTGPCPSVAGGAEYITKVRRHPRA